MALTREISPSMASCELTHVKRVPIDLERARAQHRDYEQALVEAGCRVERLPAGPEMPDAVFVEDTAVVLDEVAVMTRPGAATRRGEIESIATVLSAYKRLVRIQPPGTLDGGDVLRVGRTLYVGLSSRTNREGVSQLETLVNTWRYEVIPVEVNGCLHLKSAVTQVAEHILLINPRFVRAECFAALEMIAVAPAEPDAGNALWIGAAVIYPAHYPETRERLERAGVRVVPVPSSELAKAEGGVTCCSLLFEVA